jgi:hypothetical protein
MNFLRRLFSFLKKEEKETAEIRCESFSEYITKVPEILVYLRRERKISGKELELALVDKEDEPVWKIDRILELLIPNLNLLYLLTDRQEEFADLADSVLEEQGLLVVLLPGTRVDSPPGNLVLNLKEWENHLDIMRTVGYNTLIR